MTLTYWAALQAYSEARERLQRAKRRCNTRELNKATQALKNATTWVLKEERYGVD